MTDNESPVSGYFDAARSTTYDRKIRASIPGYNALHEMTHHLLRTALPEEADILIVGAGTGMELITMGRANPGWSFTAVDVSEEMLSICSGNITSAGIADRVKILCGGIHELSSEPSFHAATSILVSHFIKESNKRLEFFKSIAERLLEHGTLVTADIVADKSDPAFDRFVKSWKAHYTYAGIPDKEVEEDFKRSFRTVSFIPEDELFSILAGAGFAGINRFFQAFLFNGWFCQKA